MESTTAEKRQRLVSVITPLYQANRGELEDLKCSAVHHWDSRDFIWESLLRSASTMGNARGIALMNPEFSDPIRYEMLLPLSADDRRATITRCLQSANVRWSNQKTDRLVRNFERINDAGGPQKIKDELIGKSGRDDKIKFLRTFKGIGKKYSRNLMMDAYHEDFRDSIAIDDRLKKVMKALGLTFDDAKYTEAEDFFAEAAHQAGLNGWELDRLLFLHLDQVLTALKN